jgi:hypothetical protein
MHSRSNQQLSLLKHEGKNSSTDFQKALETRFLEEVRHHLSGLLEKVQSEFSETSFHEELHELRSDPVYPKFGFDTADYVLVRFMGRVSISIGRRLGEIYDKIPRFVAAARFNLKPEQVAPKIHNLELDIGLRYSQLSDDDRVSVAKVVKKTFIKCIDRTGIGIEIRYNFNPNDSARLRKDVDMAKYLLDAGLMPVYLVFSSISPREEAIARLKRAGWEFLVGEKAIQFGKDLFGLDLAAILDRPRVRQEILSDVGKIMAAIKTSYAFKAATKKTD